MLLDVMFALNCDNINCSAVCTSSYFSVWWCGLSNADYTSILYFTSVPKLTVCLQMSTDVISCQSRPYQLASNPILTHATNQAFNCRDTNMQLTTEYTTRVTWAKISLWRATSFNLPLVTRSKSKDWRKPKISQWLELHAESCWTSN